MAIRSNANILNPTHILLTGGTGYIGAFLLERLLRDTQADVYCLVRAASPADGLARLKKSLTIYRAWNDVFTDRIHILTGDLAKPLMGLSPAQFAELAARIDSIYHSGALVNFAYPYATLKATNVQGTQEVIRLACQVKPKAIHYLGTVDALIATHIPRPWLEVEPSAQLPVTNPPDGYLLSKWVAENLIIAARSRGVPVCVYRPPWTIGHTATGASPRDNFMLLQLKSYLEFGMFPESIPGDDTYTGVPVDYLAHAIVFLSRQEASLGKIFQPWNPQPTHFDRIYDWIRSFGYKFDVVSRQTIYERVRNIDRSHPFYPLLPIIERDWGSRRPEADTFDPRIECANVLKGLEKSDIRCPETDEKLVHLCLQYLIDIGFLKPPDA